MWPSTSAKTRLNVGTAHGRVASRNSLQLPARFMPSMAVSQPHGSKPSQRSDTGPVPRAGAGSTSSTIGPFRDERIVLRTGSAPLHLDDLFALLAAGSHWPS